MLNNKSILLVDDDPAFRQMIVSLLSTKGLSVLEAETKKEASNILAKGEPALAIVDYALPDGDGVSWVSDVRAAGKQMPIVFITGHFCDAKTFNWLRNILHVSLVLQKPISPELFLQQLEGILPFLANETAEQANIVDTSASKEPVSRILAARDKLINEFPQAKDQIDAALDKNPGAPESILLDKLKQIAQKLAVESALLQAKQDYYAQLPALWQSLSTSIAEYKNDLSNENLKKQILNEAHKLKGTAGSYGFIEVGKAAGTIEEALKSVDHLPTEQQSVVWTEIASAQSAGEIALNTTSSAGDLGKPLRLLAKELSVLLLTKDENLRQKITNMPSMQAYRFYFASSLAEAILRTKTVALAGAIVDLKSNAGADYLPLGKELRAVPGNGSIPLVAIMNKEQLANCEELTYLGFSPVVSNDPAQTHEKNTVTEEELIAAICKLLEMRNMNRPRILLVDDDPAMGRFISSLLEGEGMVCHVLSEPIEILEELERFKPDIIILDVLMPGLSGYDVCRLLRSNPLWQNLIIFFLTLKQDVQGRLSAFKVGADDFLSKPVISEELIVRVRNHLERSRMMHQRSEFGELAQGTIHSAQFVELEKTFSTASVQGRGGIACMIKIDNFDQIGHHFGFLEQDNLITQFGSLIQSRFQGNVRRYRLRDNIYLLLFPDNNIRSVSHMMKKLVEEFGKPLKAKLKWALLEFPQERSNAIEAIELLQAKLSSGIKEKARAALKI